MSGDGGLHRALDRLLDRGAAWVDLGVITAIEEHDSYGYLLTVSLQPEGAEVQARPVWLMGGAQGEGIYSPIAVDDEVVVLLPAGDRNRAIALVGPPSGPSKPPAGWANDRISMVHSGGTEVRLAEAATVERVVVESLLTDLQSMLTELAAGLTTLGVPTPTTDSTLPQMATGYRSASLSTDKG